MREGIFAALDAIEEATGEKKVTAIGYCVGGTLLGVALAYMAAKRDRRIDSATFFTAQVDFTDAGDLKMFVNEEQIGALERCMKERGYLAGTHMANAFNMLRPNDLIWPYVVNVYMKGKRPSRSTCSTGTPIPRGCLRPTTRSTCATAISTTSSPRARWTSAA